MADVAEIVGSDAADVHADLALHPRLEGLLLLLKEEIMRCIPPNFRWVSIYRPIYELLDGPHPLAV